MIELEEAVEKACQVLLKQRKTEIIPITEGAGRVCGKKITADIPVPSFPRSGMDGYAVFSEDTLGATAERPVKLQVTDSIFAGEVTKQTTGKKGTAVRIMTGAPIPENFDGVIKQEWTNRGKNQIEVYHEIPSGCNYGQIGEDIQLNQTVISKHQYLTHHGIGVLASLGIKEVEVLAPLRVGILSTGSELQPLGSELGFGKIYNSIGYSLASLIESTNGKVIFQEISSDDVDELADQIKENIQKVDLLITTGGVSVGEKDYLSKVMGRLGGEKIFHFVKIKPGTPVMATRYQNRLILSLSGNPFAAMVNFHLFYWAVLAKFMQCSKLGLMKREVILTGDLPKSNLRRFIQAYEEDGLVYFKKGKQPSSVFRNLLESNCLIDQTADRKFEKGEKVTVYYWKDS